MQNDASSALTVATSGGSTVRISVSFVRKGGTPRQAVDLGHHLRLLLGRLDRLHVLGVRLRHLDRRAERPMYLPRWIWRAPSRWMPR